MIDFPITIWNLAKFMHMAYEQRAMHTGWETQESCRVPFEDLPVENRRTMLLVALDVLSYFAPDRIVLDPSDVGGYQLEYETRQMAEKARGRKP